MKANLTSIKFAMKFGPYHDVLPMEMVSEMRIECRTEHDFVILGTDWIVKGWVLVAKWRTI